MSNSDRYILEAAVRMECAQLPPAQQLAAVSTAAALSELRDCRVVDVEMEVGGGSSSKQGGSSREGAVCLAGEAAEPGVEDTAQLPFSKELITFSLFGKMPAKLSKQLLRSSVCC